MYANKIRLFCRWIAWNSKVLWYIPVSHTEENERTSKRPKEKIRYVSSVYTSYACIRKYGRRIKTPPLALMRTYSAQWCPLRVTMLMFSSLHASSLFFICSISLTCPWSSIRNENFKNVYNRRSASQIKLPTMDASIGNK